MDKEARRHAAYVNRKNILLEQQSKFLNLHDNKQSDQMFKLQTTPSITLQSTNKTEGEDSSESLSGAIEGDFGFDTSASVMKHPGQGFDEY